MALKGVVLLPFNVEVIEAIAARTPSKRLGAVVDWIEEAIVVRLKVDPAGTLDANHEPVTLDTIDRTAFDREFDETKDSGKH
jgi:hypothetical protein